MPSVFHEALVQLFRDRPSLAPDLLRDALGIPLPDYTEVRTEQPAVGEARELRNRLGAMLLDRMQRVRAAARFVFRKHPELVREVTSKYARAQRASQRSRAEEEEVDLSPASGGAALAGAPTA